ncbi:MAG: ABC transporter permease [Verrucomicrobia bacterium]|nr:ABC transporter permease [Verrucomicrobiota bacterium]
MALTRGIEDGTRIFMQQMGGLELVTIVNKEPSSRKYEFANLSPGRTLRDAEAIRRSATFISHVSPEISLNTAVATDGGGNPDRRMVRGVYPDHFVIAMHQIAAGRFLTALDLERGSRCAVVGDTVAKNLWPGIPPPLIVGKSILIDNRPFEVVGVLPLYEMEEQARARRSGRSISRRWDPFRQKNETVLVPFTTMFHELRSGAFPLDSLETMKLETLTVRVGDLDHFRPALDQVRRILDTTHRGVDDFDLETRQDWFDRMESSVRAARLSGGLISAISLVVGGIGIMNIMLASISERVREIGIRLAVGARQRDIFWQILIESILVSLLGGLLGILASLGLIEILKTIAPTENVPVLTPDSILLAVGFALAAGLLSGLYPAAKASTIDPITALRYE